MSTISELLGIGTRENLNPGMLFLQGLILLILTMVPFLLGEITHKKKYYLLTTFCTPVYVAVLAFLAKWICQNPAQSIRLMIYAVAGFLEYALFITAWLHQKKKHGYSLR